MVIKKMKKNRFVKIMSTALLIIIIPFMCTPLANADGWHPSAEQLHLYEPAQKAVISWDGTTQIMYLSSAVKSDNLTDIAWVVPITSTTKPEVSAGNMTVFEELVDYFDEYYWWHSPFRKLVDYGKGNGNITIIEVSEVDIYDVIILKASNATDLIDWLTENNLLVPEEAHKVIKRYVEKENCYFVVNKLDLKNRFKDTIEKIEKGEIPENMSEYLKVLEDLKKGMATPLKFEFTPLEPYYPLVISSLNAGKGAIEIYVIGEKPVADSNNIMRVDHCKQIDKELKDKLKEFFSVDKAQYVTRLYYNGELKDLSDDAVFEFFTRTSRYDSVFLYIPSELENLTGKASIDIMVFDPKGGLIELQYRIDNSGPWMVADRSDISYIFKSWYKRYNVYVAKSHEALWTINLDTANLTDKNHSIELRILHEKYSNIYYSAIHSFNFTKQNENITNKNITNNYSNKNQIAILLSSLVVISMATVAVISKKTKSTKTK